VKREMIGKRAHMGRGSAFTQDLARCGTFASCRAATMSFNLDCDVPFQRRTTFVASACSRVGTRPIRQSEHLSNPVRYSALQRGQYTLTSCSRCLLLAETYPLGLRESTVRELSENMERPGTKQTNSKGRFSFVFLGFVGSACTAWGFRKGS